jgi:hypothetical protein
MGEKPKKDKDRLKKQKILNPKKSKASESLSSEHLGSISGGQELHPIANLAAYSEIDKKTR